MADISKIKLPDNSEYEIKDAKARMVILKYGISTWQDFLAAYQNNCIVYCRASSNNNPATGSQTRMAFMAYVSDATNPTNVEFQYYRSVNKHTDSQQGNQVFVYKLTNANKWTVTVRNTFSKVIAGDNLTSSFVESETNSSITLSADYDSVVTQNSTKLITSGAVHDAISAIPSGASALSELTDVSITTPSNGQVLTYDSSNQEWINANSSGGSSTLSGLSDVDLTTPADGQVLKYDGANQEWINAAVPAGLTDTIKQSLLACFSNVSWTCPIADTQTYYNDLRESLYPGATLTSITCAYTQTHVAYPDMPLDNLRDDLVVTANFSDGSSDIISYYTLSGTLASGTSTITAEYLDNTDTFDVIVDTTYLYAWDFTRSLVDQVQGVTAQLGAATGAVLPVRTSNGIELTAATQGVKLLSDFTFPGRTIEFDIANMVFGGSKSNHIRMIMYSDTGFNSGDGPLIWRYTSGWSSYTSGWTGVWSGMGGTSDEVINSMSGKTVKLVFHENGQRISLYIDDTLIEAKDMASSYSSKRYLHFGGSFGSASNGDQCYNVTLSGIRIYENE